MVVSEVRGLRFWAIKNEVFGARELDANARGSRGMRGEEVYHPLHIHSWIVFGLVLEL
jgi:hypothetical protein